MIRIAIVADTLTRARHLEALLADDERLEIIDIRMAGTEPLHSGVDVIVAFGVPSAKMADFVSPVVVVSSAKPQFVRNVRASLPLTASATDIVAAIEAAASDLTVLTQEQALCWIPSSAREAQGKVEIEELTSRELQILRLIADGSSNKEISIALNISQHTVKFHVAQVLSKLNASSRAEAVSLGIRRGLVAI